MRPSKTLVLAYHAVEAGPGPLCVDPVDFASVAATFAERGYAAMTVSQLAETAVRREDLPDRTVLFTFDDGYESVYHHALPVLAELGYRATVFPVSAYLGGRNLWDVGVPGIPELTLMSEEQLSSLVDAGWEIGGHTHTHPRLPELSDTQIEEQLAASEEVLSRITGTRLTSFAYPYGRYDARVRSLAGRRYRICLGIGVEPFRLDAPFDSAPRVEGWYVRNRRQALLVAGSMATPYLGARRRLRLARARLEPMARGGER